MSEQEKTEHVMASPSLTNSVNQACRSSVFTTGNWPEEKWWHMFESPLLNEWIEQAFMHNPSLQGVEAKLLEAGQIAKIARSRLFPYLFFDADDDWRHLSRHSFFHLLNPDLSLNGYEVDVSLSFRYEFDFWGKYRNLYRAALGEALAQEAEIAEARLILSTALSQAYFALAIHLKQKDLYEELKKIRQSRFLLRKKLQREALSSALPPLADEQMLKEAEQALAGIQDEIAMDQHLISVLMGKGPDDPLFFETSLIQAPPSITLPEDLSLDLLSRRPDLMAQIWRVEALAHEVGAAKADFFPDVNLMGYAGFDSVSFSNLFSLPSKAAGIKPALHLPVFTAGAIKANVRAKKSAFDTAVFQYNQMVLQSAQEVADLLSNITSIYQKKQMQDAIVQESSQRLSLTALRQEKGLDSSFALFDFQDAFIERLIQNLDLQYYQYAFIVKLMKALGGGYKSPSPLPIQARDVHE